MEMTSNRAYGITRRDLLRMAAVASAAACGPALAQTSPTATAAGVGVSPTQAAFDWKRYAGTTIRYLDWNGTWSMFINKKKADFEVLTGIKVEWELLPQEQHRQKVPTELTARNKDLDLLFVAPHVDGPRYWKAGWLEPFDNFLKDPRHTPADWEPADFAEGLWKTSQFDGKQVSVPSVSECQIVTYRRDLFEKKGLKPPTTMEELRKVAAALHDPPNVFGIVGRGNAPQGPVSFSSFLYSFGGDYTDAQRRSMIDQPPAIEAMEYWGRLYRDYGPPGMNAMGFAQATALFMQGRAGMIIDANHFRANYIDPSKSKVTDVLGHAMFPKGPVSQTPGIFTAGPSISALSQKKGPAWYLILWATSKEMQLESHRAGIAAARKSAWSAPATGRGTDPVWVDVTQKTMSISSKGYSPNVTAVFEVRNRVGELLTQVLGGLTGQQLREAAAAASRDVNAIIARTE
jgi:multiple sugar transport system substrate-binding protein